MANSRTTLARADLFQCGHCLQHDRVMPTCNDLQIRFANHSVGHGGPCRTDTDKFRCYPNRVANIARPRRCIREWPLRARRTFADHLPGRARRREERQSSKRWRLPLPIRTLSCSWRLAPLLRSTSSYLRVRVNALLLRKRLALMRVHSRRSRTSVGRWNRRRSAVSARELRHQPVIMRRRIRSLQTK
jgi:hypothetical protein